MFDNTLDITIGGATVTLNRVNQDNYGSVYQAIGTKSRTKLYIRHTSESSKGDVGPMDRHNLFLERWTYPSNEAEGTGRPVYTSATFTFRGEQHGGVASQIDLANALSGLIDTTGMIDALAQGVN